MVPSTLPMPSKMVVPPETLTPEVNAGSDEAETTMPLPPLDGVLKAKVSLPLVRAYQMPLFQEEAW